ncbi:MAG: hypothetical protein HRU15_06680 [Planctomycetes bacterium]|nr:hypothetical protein [Planctomycetota bacterium]
MVKKVKTRSVKDFRRSIRKDQPKVDKDIDKLVSSFLKSADYKQFKKRFSRR